MMKTRQLLFIFIPAILVVGFAFFVQVIKYEPLYPSATSVTGATQAFHVPVSPNDPILGDKKAPITMMVFADFGCESCKELDGVLDTLLKTYPKKIKIIWKGLPTTRFPYDTTRAHEYAFCANKQKKFIPWKDRAFANSDNLSPNTLITIAQQIPLDEKKLTACLDSGDAAAYVNQNSTTGTALNIQSVPAIFINDQQVNAPSTVEAWAGLLKL